ncbi:SRPBCC domain-containing protein [Arthrobacter sp. zg-Y1171]|uniref:SRPBCC domain-containing protein n=1 Tax=Arthrobacter sp. zg-Y1171 TaxID=2964610 RepID=UPI0021074A92|nr:SRPBCC domain-containing protein [Arthrobacter sp. zg-Y1171]MCQ1993809.1 SRPBCC domain-containing protein [Arthrobacter sp. zg-Y1171]UWX82061.1 SRPBCC domain-containing protein [Arthrobacter sp. zg-Y1171]
MQPEPTGRVIRTGPESYDLILHRSFPEPAAAVWPSFTDPELTAQWFGRWEGTPGRGGTVDLQLLFEEGLPWSRVRIAECVSPELLRLLVEDEYGGWDLEIRLRDDPAGTALDFIHHLEDPQAASSIGPGWEYYLDRLLAARSGGPAPDFEDYFPSQDAYFAAQADAAADTTDPA